MASTRPTVKRLVMALTEGVHFFKTQQRREQENSSEIYAAQRRSLPGSRYEINAKLLDRVPYVTREGMEIQLKEALSKKPGSTVKVDDIVDDSIVAELEKEGFIDKLYKP